MLLTRRAAFAWRALTSRYRALPDFVIIGAAKSGTTSLFEYLARHPGVIPPFSKEIHFFDYGYARGEAWYRRHFPLRRQLERGGPDGRSRALTFEATPYYLAHPLVPERMARLMPDVKLVCLLRDPVSRTISSYYNQVRLGREPLELREAIESESERIAGEEERLRREPGYHSRIYKYFAYRSRSEYARQLANWFAHFSREQIGVWQAERFFRDTARVFAEILEFVGLPDWRPESFPTFNPRTSDASRDQQLIEELRRHFRPHNEKLYSLLGQTYDWQ